MKLRDKKTGAVYSIEDIDLGNNVDGIWLGMTCYKSLAELNEEWEDYEEPKKYWYITGEGDICRDDIEHGEWIEERKFIGNYFESEEEAEKAVEKLKAWKRLKDKGFRFKDYTRKFDGFKRVDGSVFIVAELDDEGVIGMIDELNICFGGEE